MVEGSGGKYFLVSPPKHDDLFVTPCIYMYKYIYEWVGSRKKVTTDQGFQGKYTQGQKKVIAWLFFRKFDQTFYSCRDFPLPYRLPSKQGARAAVLLL